MKPQGTQLSLFETRSANDPFAVRVSPRARRLTARVHVGALATSARRDRMALMRARVAGARTRFDAASSGCHDAMNARLEDARQRLGLVAASLDALSPLAVLQRGYAIVQDKDGRLLRDGRAVAVGDAVRLRLARGRLDCRVEGKSDENKQ